MKILLLTMNKGDATSYYRAAGVVKDLEKRTGHTIDVYDWTDLTLNWVILSRYEAVWMQRPISREAVACQNYLRLMNKPIWVEYDDDLFNLPASHPMVHIFAAARENIISILQNADVVTVTTQGIKESYEQFNGNIHIVENAVKDEILTEFTGTRSDVLLYRGMKSHMADVYAYGNHIQALINDGYKIKFIGINPFFLTGYTLLEERDIYHYFKYLRDIRPLCLMFPLIDNTFNRAKSNICWLEATMCGSIVAAPDWPEWQKPGILHYKPETFYRTVKAIAENEVDVDKMYRDSYEYIRENLVLSKINAKRAEILERLIARDWDIAPEIKTQECSQTSPDAI